MTDDLISRKKAIEVIRKYADIEVTSQPKYLWVEKAFKTFNDDIVRDVSELPSEPCGCPFYIGNKHDRGDDSLCGLFHRETKYLAIETRQVGEWIDDNCSVCGQYVHHGDARNYCPNCGAIMVEGGSK